MPQIIEELRKTIKEVVPNPSDIHKLNGLVDDLKVRFEDDIGVIYMANRMMESMKAGQPDKIERQSVHFLPLDSKIMHSLRRSKEKSIPKSKDKEARPCTSKQDSKETERKRLGRITFIKK